jgi:hypothetical protein
MKADAFARHFPRRRPAELHHHFSLKAKCRRSLAPAGMGLGAGGKMKQEVYKDTFELADWDLAHGSRCFVHLVNSLVWRAVTGQHPPTPPPTAKQYAKAGLPWYAYYDETATPMEGSSALQNVKSVADLGEAKGQVPLPENEPCTPAAVVPLRPGRRRGQVREGAF